MGGVVDYQADYWALGHSFKQMVPSSSASSHVAQPGGPGTRPAALAAVGVAGRGGVSSPAAPPSVAESGGEVRVVLLCPRYVLFDSGDLLRVGQTAELGAARGWRLDEVDDAESISTFSCGGVVRHVGLNRPWVPGSAGGGSGSAVQGVVSSGSRAGAVVRNTGHGGARLVVGRRPVNGAISVAPGS